MNKKLKFVFTKYQNQILRVQYENEKPVEIHFSDDDQILGTVYNARVKDIVPYLNAAFVEYLPGKKAYFQMDQNPEPVYTKKCNPQNPKLSCGDEILIQISKEAMKTKDPVATSAISFTGRYLVLTVGKNFLGFSGKIHDEKWKTAMKDQFSEICTDEYGFIFRTNSYGVAADVVKSEAASLSQKWDLYKKKAIHSIGRSMIYQPPKAYIQDIVNAYGQAKGYELTQVITDDAAIFSQLQDYWENTPYDHSILSLYQDPMVSLDKVYRIEKLLGDALNQRVWLKSGGYLVIEPTEAMTVIDVNTGKMVSGKKNQAAILKLNLEAAKEIAYQLRLRNISGIIVVDFINMDSREDKQQLMDRMQNYLANDPVRTCLVDMTQLNLVEITRKKIHKTLREMLKKKTE